LYKELLSAEKGKNVFIEEDVVVETKRRALKSMFIT
jgi:hypothetical protein